MAKTRPSSPRARLFLALDPPRETRAALARWRDALVAGRDDLRPVPGDYLHATLVFLGWQYEREVERIASLASEALGGLPAARLEPAGVKQIPPRGPRLFALDLRDPDGATAAIQTALSDALREARLYRPEKRPFWPHLTLARVKRGRRAPPLEASSLPAPFTAFAVTLYRSTLRPQGAVYDALEEVELGG